MAAFNLNQDDSGSDLPYRQGHGYVAKGTIFGWDNWGRDSGPIPLAEVAARRKVGET
jgi:hypothetical protein